MEMFVGFNHSPADEGRSSSCIFFCNTVGSCPAVVAFMSGVLKPLDFPPVIV